MTRPVALIAVGAAVALAGAVVVAGVTVGVTGDGVAAQLPSGHPSVAGAEGTATGEDGSAAVNIRRLERASAEHPDDMSLLLDLGGAYYLGRRLRQADATFSRVLATDPGNAAATVGLAMVWHARGLSRRAERALRGVIAGHPDQQAAHYSLAIVLFSDGKLDEAEAEWQTAADIDFTARGHTVGSR